MAAAIPFQIWITMIFLAVICTYYTWKNRDRNYYTNILTGLFSSILWILSAYSFFISIFISESGTTYANEYLAYIFMIPGLFMGLYTFVEILGFTQSMEGEPADGRKY